MGPEDDGVMSSARTKALLDHLRRFFPGRPLKRTPQTGRFVDELPEFEVVSIPPRSDGEGWHHVSLGASAVASSDMSGHELISMCPEWSERDVLHVTMVANMHADPRYPLHAGKTLRVGEPWFDGSPMDHVLVSLPYAFDPDFETCRIPGGGLVHFLWLLPIHESEARLIRSGGLETFEERMERAAADVLDPRRAAVA